MLSWNETSSQEGPNPCKSRKKGNDDQIYKQVRNEDAVEYGDLIGEITFPIQQVRDDITSFYTKSMSFYTKSKSFYKKSTIIFITVSLGG